MTLLYSILCLILLNNKCTYNRICYDNKNVNNYINSNNNNTTLSCLNNNNNKMYNISEYNNTNLFNKEHNNLNIFPEEFNCYYKENLIIIVLFCVFSILKFIFLTFLFYYHNKFLLNNISTYIHSKMNDVVALYGNPFSKGSKCKNVARIFKSTKTIKNEVSYYEKKIYLYNNRINFSLIINTSEDIDNYYIYKYCGVKLRNNLSKDSIFDNKNIDVSNNVLKIDNNNPIISNKANNELIKKSLSIKFKLKDKSIMSKESNISNLLNKKM